MLREEDIWDLEDYFQRNLKRAETKVFNSFFWDRLARTAPYLGLAERADFFSILWGEHRDLTDLYRTLIESLAKLNFSEKAYCQIDALSPAATWYPECRNALGAVRRWSGCSVGFYRRGSAGFATSSDCDRACG